MGTKNLDENSPNPFFVFFAFFQSAYGNESGPDLFREICLSVS